MANMQLPDDVVRTYKARIGSIDAAGTFVPNPGAVYTGTATPPVINFVVDSATGDVTANAVGPDTLNVSVLWQEAGGTAEAAVTEMWDVVEDTVPVSVANNPSAAFTDVPQPRPSQTPTP